MKDQLIKTDDLLEWKNDQVLKYASNYGSGINKALACDLNGNYLVYDQNNVILITTYPQQAVDKYNEI